MPYSSVGCVFSCLSLVFSSFICVSKSLISCSMLVFSSARVFLQSSKADSSSSGFGVSGWYAYDGSAHHHRGSHGNLPHTCGSVLHHPLP